MNFKKLVLAMTFTYLLVAVMAEESGGVVECWEALMELKSCTNEILVFFLNGQASLGPDCCRAIHIISQNCWPSMLTSLGFTSDEANILATYCSSSSSSSSSAPAAAPPL
ncbi:egg cell-secreted protein 1.2-like [Carica papaya]|uniref:egg cell-secreted protein 1.2-like n=1 Tax=Carica papaya TaxID=3649 RepID=UPI000B8CB3B1|nr:egg cell-secreted protein 1.2-like [Carica papaya]